MPEKNKKPKTIQVGDVTYRLDPKTGLYKGRTCIGTDTESYERCLHLAKAMQNLDRAAPTVTIVL